MKVDDFDGHLEDIGARWLGNDEVDLSTLSTTSSIVASEKLAVDSK